MKISTSSKVNVFKFSRFIFRGSYFRVLVVGRENRENLDLAKISRYTVRQHNRLIHICNMCMSWKRDRDTSLWVSFALLAYKTVPCFLVNSVFEERCD